MVSNAGNVVGLMNYISLYNIVALSNFVIFSLGSLASPTMALSWGMLHRLARAQHLVSEPACSSLAGALGSSVERQATRFVVCT